MNIVGTNMVCNILHLLKRHHQSWALIGWQLLHPYFTANVKLPQRQQAKCHQSNKAWPIKDDWYRLIHQAFRKCKFSKISLMHYLSFSSEHKKGCCSLSHTTSSHHLACSAGVFNNASVLYHCSSAVRLTGRWQTRLRRLVNSCDAGLPVFGWLWITPSMH